MSIFYTRFQIKKYVIKHVLRYIESSTQLELINETLAELQAKKKEAEKPRPQIGYAAIMERRKNEGKE